MKISDTLYCINCSNKEETIFENLYPVNGMTYNSYLIKDDVTILLDTVDQSVNDYFLKELELLLGDTTLDYIIVNHTEPDHAYTLTTVLEKYPDIKVIVNKITKNLLVNLYNITTDNFIIVDEEYRLTTSNYKLRFYMAPFVHWPEVMVTYCEVNKVLFSADAFGSFGTNTMYDDINIDDFRRYYTNICGKYGVQVNNLLNKLNVEVKLICPLHGCLIKDKISFVLNKYNTWSTYSHEDEGVLIIYSSIYGNTKNVAYSIKDSLNCNSEIYDVSNTHFSELISKSFKYKNIVIASITYNNSLFPYMHLYLNEFTSHNIQNKNIFLIENGSWAPLSNKIITSLLEPTNNNIVSKLSIKGSLKESLVDFINTIK